MSLSRRPLAVDICVCTFRRPILGETIRSLAALEIPDGIEIKVIVADNDVVPSAEELVARLATEIPFPILYLHAPACNISVARNACLDAATGDFAAFIDDDETVTPGWLAALLAVVEAEAADVVLGPARAVYAAKAPDWMKAGDFHSTLPVWVNGKICSGYTCNVLLRRASPFVAGLRFKPELGQSGGEDTDFFTRLTRAGGRIAYAEKAVVDDPVPADRASFAWLVKRRFRMGQTHGRVVIGELRRRARAGQVGLAAGKAGLCFIAAAAHFPFAARRNRFALRGAMHVGVVSALLGMTEIRPYGDIQP
ncbi:glycosyl transferase family A [Aureimonas sp. SA4125]|uniref:glycosyltransferase n=1 Tax=Aureimonas sp. SA4125 TaxID=2826993 RepID=UPI001CC421A1|nr:glycosyltransferase family 2 protein [Aureimonas sp. SA4125]BDA83387.1 glycosyl transferase family A [Aureimonas sp. SA4125]